MLNKTIWNLQNQILENIKDEMKHSIGVRPPILRKYYNDYKRTFLRFQSFSSYEELIADIKQVQIVYCGDYHTLKEAQLTNIKLLNKLINKNSRIIIAMEAFLSKHQELIDLFMKNQLSTEQFLNKINYDKTFGFNWKNYEPILNFAKQHKIKIIGLDTQPIDPKKNLLNRDKKSAAIIAHYAQSFPDHLIWVIIGDLHLAPNHLPAETNNELKKRNIKLNDLIVYQNSESIYKILVLRDLVDKIEVIKLRKNTYCIMNTPPWFKYQTYIHWMEHGENLRKQYLATTNNDEDMMDVTDDIAALILSLTGFLELKGDNLLDYSVYTPDDVSFLNIFPKKSLEYKIYRKKMIGLNNFIIPEYNILYLSNISIDNMIEIAAMHIFFTLSRTSQCLGTSIHDFYTRILISALSFFCSKIINYKINIASLDKFLHDSIKNKSQINHEIASLILLHESLLVLHKKLIYSDSNLIKSIHDIASKDVAMNHSVSSYIGKMLGNKLYYSFQNKNEILTKIKSFFIKRPDTEGAALELYFSLIKLAYAYEYE